MNFWKHYRLTLWTIFWVSALGMAFSLTAQYGFGMNPCVMCIQQRMALLGVALCSGLMLLSDLQTTNKKIVATAVVSMPTLFGLYIAAQQVYLQQLPLDLQPSCGAPWTFRLRGMPLFEWYEPLIRGTGSCGEVYPLLGLPLSIWSALFFSAVFLTLIVALFLSCRARPKKYIAR